MWTTQSSPEQRAIAHEPRWPRADQPIIDHAKVAEFREYEQDGDPTFLRDLFATFLADAPARIAAIVAAAASGDAAALALEAHTLKGACLEIGALEMALFAFQLERRGKARDLSEAAQLVGQLEGALARVRDAIDDLSA